MVRFVHAVAALATWCISASAEAVSRSEPLAHWLHSLKLSLGDVEASKFGLSFKASGVICSELSIGRMRSTLSQIAGDAPSFDLNLQGLGIRCTGHWNLPIGSGEFSASVLPDSSASIGIILPVDEDAVPQRTELAKCNAALQFKVFLGGGIKGKILSWLVGLLSGKIEHDVRTKLCTDLKEMAMVNGTAAVQKLNQYMLPPPESNEPKAEAVMARRLKAAQKVDGAVDWNKIQAMKFLSWVFKDFVEPSDLDQLLNYATKGTGRFSLNGAATPLAHFSFALSGSKLEVSTGFDEVQVNGIDSVEGFEPISAASSSDLAAALSLGTPERPSVGLESKLWIRIKSSTSDSNVSNELLEKAHVKLGLEKPRMNAQVRLLLQEEELQFPRTFAQWLLGPKGCFQDILIASPSLQDFHVNFAGVSEPLTLIAGMEGQLEQDITNLINNMVTLFNSIYLRYLPAAISRFAGSQEFLDIANSKIAEIVPPSPLGFPACIDADMAQVVAAKRLPQVADWRSIFGGQIRQYIDNMADGFVSHNDTQISKRLPSYRVITNEADLELVPGTVHLTGLSAIKDARLLLPDDGDAQLLSNQISISCPDEKQTWLPAVDMVGDIVEPSRSYKNYVMAHAVFPCGHVKQTIRAALDTLKALSMPASLSSLVCMPSTFSNLKVESMTGSLQHMGHLIMQMGGQPSEEIIGQLCSSYPRLCERVSKLVKRYHVDEVNSFLAKLLQASSSLSQCDSPSPAVSAAKSVSAATLARDSGNSHDLTWSPILWGCTFICTASLTLIATTCISRCAAAANSQTESSMAVICWSDKTRYAQASAASFFLILAFVLRTVSIFILYVGHSYAIVKTADLGPLLRIDLITFTFFGMVQHYWEAGAWIMSGLLLLNSFLVAYGVILMGLFIWMVPALKQHHSFLIRATVFVSRLPLVDVCFFSLIISTLKSRVPMPLGVGNDLQCEAGTAIYVGVVSTFCGMLGAQLLRIEHKWDRPVESSTWSLQATRSLKVIVATVIFAGMTLCLIADILNVNYGGLAGDVLSSVSFTLLSLLAKTFSADAALGLILVVMVIIAPLLQASALILGALQFPCGWLLEAANTLSLLDIFVASLVATSPEINSVATWILDNKFGNLCALLSTYAEVECIEVAPNLAIAGFIGVCLASVCSLGISLHWGFMEMKAGYRHAQNGTCMNPV